MEQQSHYNRANDLWICGNKANGCPCRKGPDKKGSCGAALQCIPVKHGDRWHCTRSSILGGSCSQGPTPDGQCCQNEISCTPIPGYRQKKRHYLQLTCLFLLAFILLGSSALLLETFAKPGPLAPPHAGITECQSCHMAQSTPTPSTIVKNAFMPISIAEHNKQCSACHTMGENSINPHQLAQNQLKNSNLNIPLVHDQGVACATCHKEHQGELLPDKATQTSYCLACHEKPIYRFPESHPEFIDYPIKLVKRIQFNHKNHIERLFSKEPEFAPDNCSSCHSIDKNGIPTVASFENSCQSCHQQDVLTESLAVGPKGFAVLSIPGIDFETLQANNINIGQWPYWAEETINPVWKSILSDPSKTRVMDSMEDLLDLRDASPEVLKQTQLLALSIKQYLFNLKTFGSSEVSQNWTLQLNQSELNHAIDSWFPDLDNEIKLINANSPPPTQAIGQNDDNEAPVQIEGKNDEESFDFDDDSMLDEDSPAESLDDLFSDDENSEDESNLDDLFGDNQAAEGTNEFFAAEQTAVDAEQWVKQGGWYLQDFALYYRSTGHNDSNLRHWISKAPELFNQDSSGRCLSCHSIDKDNPSSWKSQQRNTVAARLTAFNHRQHLNMISTDNCQNCHAIAEYSEHELDFDPIKKQQCLDCHNQETNLNQCSACHNYHLPWTAIDFTSKSLFKAPEKP